jgi:hypothetical protein
LILKQSNIVVQSTLLRIATDHGRSAHEMKRIVIIVIALLCGVVSVSVANSSEPTRRDQADAERLRHLIPKMLQSSDTELVHESLLIIRSDAGSNYPPSDKLLRQVVATLRRLLRSPTNTEASTRRLACEVFWRANWKESIPVLLEALDDPYEESDIFAGPDGHAEVDWYAVWRSADGALRNLTGASPINAPRQRSPIDGQREKVRKAWHDWFKNAERDKSSVSGKPRR